MARRPGGPGSGVPTLPPISSLQLRGPGRRARASRVLAACGRDRLGWAVGERAVGQARGRAGSRVVLICSPLAAGGAAPGGGHPGVRVGGGSRIGRPGGPCGNALILLVGAGASILSSWAARFRGGGVVTLWVVWWRPVVFRGGGATRRLPNAGS